MWPNRTGCEMPSNLNLFAILYWFFSNSGKQCNSEDSVTHRPPGLGTPPGYIHPVLEGSYFEICSWPSFQIFGELIQSVIFFFILAFWMAASLYSALSPIHNAKIIKTGKTKFIWNSFGLRNLPWMDMRLFIASMAALQHEDSCILVQKYQWFCLKGLPPTPLSYKVMLSLGNILYF